MPRAVSGLRRYQGDEEGALAVMFVHRYLAEG
jgi:hypothetical protein